MGGDPFFRFESLAAAYFLLVALGATLAGASLQRTVRAIGTAALLVIIVVAASRTVPDDGRLWLPHLYLVAGYWLPAMLISSPTPSRFETWLRRHDETWRRRIGTVPPFARWLLEASYLACYVVVPLAFSVVWTRGTTQQVDRFWVTVLLAGFACYFTLPWLVSRPPRVFAEHTPDATDVASFNVVLLRTISHQFNTFPSGHVAVATAAALAVCPVWPLAGVIFGAVAACIGAGAAVGRYHYGIDVVVGVLVGILAASAAL